MHINRNIVGNTGNLTSDKLNCKSGFTCDIRAEIRYRTYEYTACILSLTATNWTLQMDPTMRQVFPFHVQYVYVECRCLDGLRSSPILSLRSQWCPHSLANKWAQSGHPHNGVPPAGGSERGPREQLAPRGAADQGCPLPLCRRGQHGKWHVWGGPPPHYWRYLDLVLYGWLWSAWDWFWPMPLTFH